MSDQEPKDIWFIVSYMFIVFAVYMSVMLFDSWNAR